MRYVQLRAFHYVATCGGFSRAAEQLHLTQPAISDQVRKLEEEYDTLLFNRRKRQVSLTEAGAQLLEVTHRLFEVESQARELLAETKALSTGTLRIAADSALHLLHILTPFGEKFPGVQVSVRTGNSNEVISAVLDYEADIGVLGEVSQNRAFNSLQLGASPLIAFASAKSEIGQSGQVSLKKLAEQPLVLREPESKTRQKLQLAAQKAGFELNIVIEAEGREAVREIVASGRGVGVVSEAEFGHDPRLAKIRILGPDIEMEEALICLSARANGKLIKAFMNIAELVAPDL